MNSVMIRLTQSEIRLNIDINDSVEILKESIMLYTSATHVSLFFNDAIMHTGTLISYGVADGAIIHGIIRS